MEVFSTIAAGAYGVGKELGIDLGGISSGFGLLDKQESKSDLEKQDIQRQLADLGYPQFSKMSGWKGDEKAKRNAMQVILEAVKANPQNALTITGWLENGKITPETISQIEDNNLRSNTPPSFNRRSASTPTPGGGFMSVASQKNVLLGILAIGIGIGIWALRGG